MEDIKCFLITMGIGFAVGAMVASSNKKVSDVAKKAQIMAMDKLEMAKEGFNNIKEKIQNKIEENEEESQDIEVDLNKNKKQTKKS